MSTGFSSMDFSGSARRSLKDYFCGRCPAFSSASCVNSPTDWFDIFPQQPHNHILHTIISHHIVSQWSPLISILLDKTVMSHWSTRMAFTNSFRHRQFECLLPRASSEHSIIRSSTSYF